MNNSKVVIILPTYNEKENIEKIITILEEEIFPQIKDHDMSILVADDNSPDGTEQEVHRLMKKWKNIQISSGEKKGLGAAYIRGMTYAIEKMNAEVLFEMDADGQHDPKKIPDFIQKIDEGYDMVVGTRYSGGGSIPSNWPIQRKAFSIVANIFVRTVFMQFGIHDWTGGYRALRKKVFLKEREALTNYSGYIFQISFLHKAVRDGFKIGEVPFHFSDRELGASKIAPLGYIIDVISFVVLARIMELKRFIKFLFVGGSGFILQYVVTYLSIKVGVAQFIAAMLGGETAILSNFFWNNVWTFKDTGKIKQHGNVFLRLLKFNLSSLFSIGLQGFVVWLGVFLLGEHINIMGREIPTSLIILFPTIIFLVLPLNYLIYNKVIWKTQYLKDKKSSEEKAS